MNQRMDRPKKEKCKFICVYVSYTLDGNIMLRTTKLYGIYVCNKKDIESSKESIAKEIFNTKEDLIRITFPILKEKFIQNSQIDISFEVI